MIKFRYASIEDAQLLYDWASDVSTRNNSYNSEKIEFKDHLNWLQNKLSDANCSIYIFSEGDKYIGQIRIDANNDNEAIIGISIDENHRGNGFASQMIHLATEHFLARCPEYKIRALVFKTNGPSLRGFLKGGFSLVEEKEINNIPSFILYKNHDKGHKNR